MGVGANLQYAVAHLTGRTVTAGGGTTDMHDADDLNVGYNVGLAWKPSKTTRLGISYRSKVTHKVKGKNHIILPLAGIDRTTDVSAKSQLQKLLCFLQHKI